jgi:hypothetical protein
MRSDEELLIARRKFAVENRWHSEWHASPTRRPPPLGARLDLR